MRTRITSRHDKLSADVRNYIDEKIGKLERFYDRIIDCEIIVKTEKLLHVFEMNVKVYSTTLHVTAKASDLTKAIDECVDKLEIQLKKFKDKMKERPHHKVASALEDADMSARE